jgi:predicted O-methyltransferase YrrM
MEHYYREVPGWAAFSKLYREVVRDAPRDRPSTFVEIGSWLGRSAAFMGVEIINSGKPITLHCIDPWIDGGPDLRDTPYFLDLSESPFDLFCRNTERVASVIKPHRALSTLVAKNFDDDSVDYIMIDGDHCYEAARDDIASWLPKMRSGSIMSGDDYLWPGVKRACEEHFGVGGVRTYIVRQHKNYRNSASYWWIKLP